MVDPGGRGTPYDPDPACRTGGLLVETGGSEVSPDIGVRRPDDSPTGVLRPVDDMPGISASRGRGGRHELEPYASSPPLSLPARERERVTC